MDFKSNALQAVHFAVKTAEHLVALQAAGESVPAIVAEEAVELVKELHDKIKAHRDQHVDDDEDDAES